MQLIAHRGLYNDTIGENTYEAFNNAIKKGYSGIELDIRTTKDNKIVIIHDALINRTSNGKGLVKNKPYKELLKYNFGTKKVNSKIPLLEDIIKKLSNTIIFIELKTDINKDELIKILDKNKTNTYYIMSFNKNYIDNLKGIKYKRGLINYIFNTTINYTDYDFYLILEDLFNENIYYELKKNNIEIIIYGILKNINLKNKELLNKIKYIV